MFTAIAAKALAGKVLNFLGVWGILFLLAAVSVVVLGRMNSGLRKDVAARDATAKVLRADLKEAADGLKMAKRGQRATAIAGEKWQALTLSLNTKLAACNAVNTALALDNETARAGAAADKAAHKRQLAAIASGNRAKMTPGCAAALVTLSKQCKAYR